MGRGLISERRVKQKRRNYTLLLVLSRVQQLHIFENGGLGLPSLPGASGETLLLVQCDGAEPGSVMMLVDFGLCSV